MELHIDVRHYGLPAGVRGDSKTAARERFGYAMLFLCLSGNATRGTGASVASRRNRKTVARAHPGQSCCSLLFQADAITAWGTVSSGGRGSVGLTGHG